MLTALLSLVLLSALGDDTVAALEGMGAEQHPCAARMVALEAALATSPTAAQRQEHALCLHALGRYDQALTALEAAVPSGPLATEDAREAAVVQVVLLAWKGQGSEATDALSALRPRLPSGHLGATRAALLVQAAGGDVPGAWAAAAAAWEANTGDAQLAAGLAELTALSPDDAPGWAREVLGQSTRVLLETNRAVGMLTGGRYQACAEQVAATLPQADTPEAARRLHVLGHRCGAFGGDLAVANTHMMKLRDLPALDDQAVLAHADLLAQVGKTGQARRLVELGEIGDERGRDTRLVRWSLELGDLDAALAAGRGGQASPESRATLGLKLHQAGRHADAIAILDAACPALGRRAKADCDGVRARAQAAVSK